MQSYHAVTETLTRLKAAALPYFKLLQCDLYSSMMYVLHFLFLSYPFWSNIPLGLPDLRLFLPRPMIMMLWVLLHSVFQGRDTLHRRVILRPCTYQLLLWLPLILHSVMGLEVMRQYVQLMIVQPDDISQCIFWWLYRVLANFCFLSGCWISFLHFASPTFFLNPYSIMYHMPNCYSICEYFGVIIMCDPDVFWRNDELPELP